VTYVGVPPSAGASLFMDMEVPLLLGDSGRGLPG
jgi:hypothetical protein